MMGTTRAQGSALERLDRQIDEAVGARKVLAVLLALLGLVFIVALVGGAFFFLPSALFLIFLVGIFMALNEVRTRDLQAIRTAIDGARPEERFVGTRGDP